MRVKSVEIWYNIFLTSLIFLKDTLRDIRVYLSSSSVFFILILKLVNPKWNLTSTISRSVKNFLILLSNENNLNLTCKIFLPLVYTLGLFLRVRRSFRKFFEFFCRYSSPFVLHNWGYNIYKTAVDKDLNQLVKIHVRLEWKKPKIR